jgi:hypothetical protein
MRRRQRQMSQHSRAECTFLHLLRALRLNETAEKRDGMQIFPASAKSLSIGGNSNSDQAKALIQDLVNTVAISFC